MAETYQGSFAEEGFKVKYKSGGGEGEDSWLNIYGWTEPGQAATAVPAAEMQRS